MKILLSIIAFLSLGATASNDSFDMDSDPELGIAPVEIEAPPKAGEELILDLPDYQRDTIVKKLEIDKKHRQKSLKYQDRRIKKSM